MSWNRSSKKKDNKKTIAVTVKRQTKMVLVSFSFLIVSVKLEQECFTMNK